MIVWKRLFLQSAKFARFNVGSRMVSSYVNEKAEPDLYKHKVSINTRNGKTVEIDCVFMDTKPNDSKLGIVAVHGAPGSHKDFKYIFPKLEGVRFIGINWPGMDYSSYDHDLVDDNEERVQIVQQIVDELKLEKIIFIGHSRGTENSLKLAALNRDKAQALVLLNPIGLRPHKGIRPYFVINYFAWLWKTFPIGHSIYNPILYWLYNKIGLRTNSGEAAGVCLNLMRYADFEKQKEYIEMLNDSQVKVLLLYAGKDFLVEVPISDELAEAFSDNKKLICTSKDDSELLADTKGLLNNGTRHVSILFPDDGHFLQKTRAGFIADSIKFLLNNQSNSRTDAKSQ